MSRKKVYISKEDLIKLYYNQKKSKYKIGFIYNCSFKTVLNRMREYGMKPLSRSIIQSKYNKRDFSGNKIEKAYLIGFRLGDLNAYKTSAHSEVIVVRTHTTRIDQVRLMQRLFSKYGKVSVNRNKKTFSYTINCFLNKSFEFLLLKKGPVEYWIAQNKNFSASFAAGYIDAEGNLGIYDGRARLKIDSYDRLIIQWLYLWMQNINIICPKNKRIAAKGKIYDVVHGYKYNKDLWRIRVSERKSLIKLLELIKPHIKHKKRLLDLNKCLGNLYARQKN